MIISASRRTDIPAFYSNWFFNRLKEGFVLVRNPMNIHQISKIKLTPDVVDGIVFWTKNPFPILNRLDELREYMYYFQFTITPYGKDVEPNLPSKDIDILNTFKRLSDVVGTDRIIWRYDPILINAKYSTEYHIHAFRQIAETLHRHTRKVTISFIDANYRGVKHNIKELALQDILKETRMNLGSALAEIAHEYDLTIDSCANKFDFLQFGIEYAHCVDDKLFEKLLGYRLSPTKDKTQRLECGCITSIDIGMYNTCRNGCLYCYANYSQNTLVGNCAKHNPSSPLISGEVGDGDKINERQVKSCRNAQLRLVDL